MQHVMLDLYSVDPERLANRDLLMDVLKVYPGVIGMVAAGEPVLRDIKTSNPLDDGMSGFVIICTSHISLHSWPPYGMVNLDVFSCEPFDAEVVARFACNKFQTQDIEIHTVERATRSPRLAHLEQVHQEGRTMQGQHVSRLDAYPQPLV